MAEDKSDSVRQVRKAFAPAITAGQDAYNQTAYCLSRKCNPTNLFDIHHADQKSLVDKVGRRAFTFAHTISSASQLREIADSNNQLAWVPMRPGEILSRKPITSKDDISKVLAFRGFCNDCDCSLFKPLDKTMGCITPEIAMLLAYRSFAYKVWRDEVDANTGRLIRNNHDAVRECSDPKLPPEKPIDNSQGQAEKLRRVADRTKNLSISNIFQSSIEAGQFHRLKSVVFHLDELLPYRYSCTSWITKDLLFRANSMKWQDCLLDPFVFLHALKVGDKTSLIVSWFDYVPDKFADKFVDSIRQLDASGDLPDALLRYAYVNNHGFAACPNWVDQWPIHATNELIQPVVAKVYRDSEITETIIPTQKWSPQFAIISEECVFVEADLPSKLETVFQCAKRDLPLIVPFLESELKYLAQRHSQLFKKAWDSIEHQNLDTAISCVAEMLVASTRMAGDQELAAVRNESWKTLAEIARQLGQFDIAYECLLIASHLTNNVKGEHEHYVRAELYDRLSNLLAEIRHMGGAMEVCEVAIKNWIMAGAETNRHKGKLASRYALKCSLYAELGDLASASVAGKTCLSMLDKTDSVQLEVFARVSNNLARIDELNGEQLSASTNGKASLNAYRKLAQLDPRFRKDARELEIAIQNSETKRAMLGQF